MKNCIDYKEQLSAYYDGELSESEALQIKNHINKCDSCSALLEMYKEFSVASETSDIPVPDALKIGVMNRIKAEELYAPAKKSKNKKQIYYTLARYIPIAACLVVVFFVWSFWGNQLNVRNDAMPQSPQFFGLIEPDEESAVSATPAAPGVSGGASDADASLGDYVDQNEPLRSSDPNGQYQDDSILPVGAPTPEPSSDLTLKFGTFEALEVSPELFLSHDESDATRRRHRADLPSQQEAEDLETFFYEASYWVAFRGDLPAYLDNYQASPLSSLVSKQLIFKIPVDDLPLFLSQLTIENEPVIAIENDRAPDSPYAAVLYSLPEDN